MSMECSAGVEGVHEDHCLHDLRRSDRAASPMDHIDGPGQICCWCGDLFLSRQEQNNGHGKYEPGRRRRGKTA